MRALSSSTILQLPVRHKILKEKEFTEPFHSFHLFFVSIRAACNAVPQPAGWQESWAGPCTNLYLFISAHL